MQELMFHSSSESVDLLNDNKFSHPLFNQPHLWVLGVYGESCAQRRHQTSKITHFWIIPNNATVDILRWTKGVSSTAQK